MVCGAGAVGGCGIPYVPGRRRGCDLRHDRKGRRHMDSSSTRFPDVEGAARQFDTRTNRCASAPPGRPTLIGLDFPFSPKWQAGFSAVISAHHQSSAYTIDEAVSGLPWMMQFDARVREALLDFVRTSMHVRLVVEHFTAHVSTRHRGHCFSKRPMNESLGKVFASGP